MPFDVAGNFTRSYNFQQDRDNGIKIIASRVDGEFDNFATGMNAVFFRDGRVPMQADLRMNINRITGLADGAVGSPALKFNTDASTGPYLDGLSRYAVSVNGVQRSVHTTTGFDLTGNFTATGTISEQGTLLSNMYAKLNSPTFTGVPLAPTAAGGTNTTQIASTAFVQNAIAAFVPATGGTFSGAVVMGGGATVGFGVSPGAVLGINSASGQVRALQFQTAGVFAADIQLQADNSTIKHNSSSGHRFDVAGSQRAVFDATGLTVISGNQQVTLNNGSNVAKAYIGTNALFGSAGTDDLRIRSEASNIVFGFTGSEVARFSSGGSLSLNSTGGYMSVTGAGGAYNVGYSSARTGQVGYHMYNGGGVCEWVTYQPAGGTGSDYRIGSGGSGSITDRFKIDGATGNTTIVQSLNVRDLFPSRGDGTGVVYFGGNTGSVPSRYLYWDGTNFNLTGPLIVGGNITSTSDARLKSGVRDLENGLALVKALRARRFVMYGKPDLGLIAQEVEPFMPEVVNRDSSGTLSVDYGRLVTPLIAAVQSLSDRLDRAGL